MDRQRDLGRESQSNHVLEAANDRLSRSTYPLLGRLACEYHDGVLVLSGRVRSFYEKQLAQESVRSLVGVDQIVNDVEVESVH